MRGGRQQGAPREETTGKRQRTVEVPLLLLSRFNKGILDSQLVIEATIKENASPIMMKTLIDFKTTTNFVFQLLIKELGNPKNESNEH